MRIAEIFYSLQGEGRLTGTPSVFIRTSGCNLRCVWCDTPYTSWKPQGDERSVAKILKEIKRYPTHYAVITGGEPFLSPDIPELTHGLRGEGYHITIETAGTVFTPVACDLISVSPKLANSIPWKRQGGKFAHLHQERRLNLVAIRQLIGTYDYQLKFVVDDRSDLAEIQQILGQLDSVDPRRVLLMAQARTKQQLQRKSEWILELCKTSGFGYSPRLHIELFGNRRGT
jgi:7-carboxy-7-deazaguanine synthase